MLAYLRGLPAPRVLLWCYLLWYAFTVARTFDPSPTLWASALGLSGVIGTGLYFSTAYAGHERRALGFWPVFRFYLMPFCVSSYSALIQDRGFVLFFHPRAEDNLAALSLCAAFCALVALAKRSRGTDRRARSSDAASPELTHDDTNPERGSSERLRTHRPHRSEIPRGGREALQSALRREP